MKVKELVAKNAGWCTRHPWIVLTVAAAISALALWATFRLPVYTSRQALLPKNTDVSRRFDSFLKKFGAASDLIVVVEGAPRNELEAFATDLADRLRKEPEIGQASERLDIQFFLEHAYLLIPPDRLDQVGSFMSMIEGMTVPSETPGLDESLSKALAWLKDHPPLTNINIDIQTAEESLELLHFFLEEWQRWLESPQPPTALGWNRLLAQHGAEEMAKGFFASRDGEMLFVFVHPKQSSEEFPVLGPFIKKVKAVAAELSAKIQAEGRTPPKVGLTGLPAIVFEEYTDVQSDISLIICTAGVLIMLLILVVVRSLRWALAIFIPMGLGVLWSTGLTLLTVGHLTIITSGFTAILFGLGVDYGIFTSSRIADERRAGRPLFAAIPEGIASSFRAVATAGGASVLIFGSLSTADFPGFSELGLVAGSGVLLILISTWMVQPALYALLPPRLRGVPRQGAMPAAPQEAPPPPKGWPIPRTAAAVLVGFAVLGAAVGGWRATFIPFDYNVLELLPKDSEAAHYQRRMVAESDYQAEVVIFTAKNLEEARKFTTEAGQKQSLAKVQSLTMLFPPDAETRIEKAHNIGASVTDAAYAKKAIELDRVGLPESTFGLLREVIENGKDLIDESQEQAFSAGHSNLVKILEKTRARIDAIQAKINEDPGNGWLRTEMFFRALLAAAQAGLKVIDTWNEAKPLTPDQLPATLRDRFFAADGTIAIYASPAKTVYDSNNLDQLMKDVYSVSPDATGFPTTHQVFSHSVVVSFQKGTLLAVIVCVVWILLALRSLRGFMIASLPLFIGGGWMLGILALSGIPYNYANIIALPLVMGLAVDYGVWFSHRWRELKDYSPVQVGKVAGKVIALAAGTELAGLGAIAFAHYRGVSTMGIAITIGLLCCLPATLFVAPCIARLLFPRRKP